MLRKEPPPNVLVTGEERSAKEEEIASKPLVEYFAINDQQERKAIYEMLGYYYHVPDIVNDVWKIADFSRDILHWIDVTWVPTAELDKSLKNFADEIVSVCKRTVSGVTLDHSQQDMSTVIGYGRELMEAIYEAITDHKPLDMLKVVKFISAISDCTSVSVMFSSGGLVTLAAAAGADINMRYKNFSTPLSKCLKISQNLHRESCIQALLSHGADMFQSCATKSQSSIFCPVIFFLADLKSEEAVSLMKLFQAHHHQPERFFADNFPNGSTWIQNYLRCACNQIWKHQKPEVITKLNFLLNESADVNDRGEWDEPPVIIAACDSRMIEYFLDACADRLHVGARGWLSRSVLHVCTRPDMIERCVKLSADVNAVDYFGRTPLMYAVFSVGCYCKYPSSFETLVVNLDSKKLCRCTDECVDRIRILVKLGADLKLSDEDGVTVVHLAAATHHKVLEILLSHCSLDDVSSMLDNTGASPLHYAVFANNIKSTEMLLKFGLDCHNKDHNGNTSLDIAHFFGFTDVVELLKSMMDLDGCLQQCQDVFQVKSALDIEFNYERVASIEMILAANKSMDDVTRASILNSPFLGCRHLDEAEEIKSRVASLIEKLSQNIRNTEPKFGFTAKLRGSSTEGTKVGFPDEFDFNLIMLNIHDPTHHQWTKADDFPKISLPFSRSEKYHVIRAIISSFHRAFIVKILKVFNTRDFWTGSKLKLGGIWMGKVGPLLTLYWNGTTYKHLKISVDLIPSFPTSDHPFIPLNNLPIPVDFSGCELHQTLDCNGVMESSYSEMEAALLKLLPRSAIEGYILAKAFRSVYVPSKPVVMDTGIIYKLLIDCVPSFVLKNVLLKVYFDVLSGGTDVTALTSGDWVERIYKRLLDYAEMRLPELSQFSQRWLYAEPKNKNISIMWNEREMRALCGEEDLQLRF